MPSCMDSERDTRNYVNETAGTQLVSFSEHFFTHDGFEGNDRSMLVLADCKNNWSIALPYDHKARQMFSDFMHSEKIYTTKQVMRSLRRAGFSPVYGVFEQSRCVCDFSLRGGEEPEFTDLSSD